MKKVVVIHKVIDKKKRTIKKIEQVLVGSRGFSIAKGKTALLPLFIKPYFANLVLRNKRLVLSGELLMARQKPMHENFVLIHGIIKKKPVKKIVHVKKKK